MTSYRYRRDATGRRRVPRSQKTTVELAEGVVVTKEVEKRLTKMAELDVRQIDSYWLRTKISGWGLILSIVPAIIAGLAVIEEGHWWGVFVLFTPSVFWFLQPGEARHKEWKTKVDHRVRELAEKRKEALDERQRFYSSPEWQLVRDQVIREKGRVCSECGRRIQRSSDVTVDHIRPRSKYPSLALNRQNLRVLCRSCNSSKGAKDWLDD